MKWRILVLSAFLCFAACGDDDSDFISRPDGKESSSACEDCDGSSSSSSVTPKSSDSETSVSSSSSAKSNSSSGVTPESSDGETSVSSSSSAKSSSSSGITPKSSDSETSVSSSSSAKSSSSSSVPEGYVDPSTVVKGTMTDERDGQTYKTVKIGTQTWMAENLNYERENSFCYKDSVEYCTKYGRLYTWAAAMDSVGTWSTNGKGCGYNKTCTPTYLVRGVCPEGWHLPTQTEWNTLFTAVDSSTAGKMLRSTSGWNSSGNGTDAYAFSALPAGDRNLNGNFLREGNGAYFWSSTEYDSNNAYNMYLDYRNGGADLRGGYKYSGFSVRCVKD